MSIANELTALSTNLSNAYDAVSNKGGTIPANKNTANLADAINSISGGGSASVLNGQKIKLKAYSTTVDANSFVELKNDTTSGTRVNIANSPSALHSIAATKIDTDKVFVVMRNSSNLFVSICTVSNQTVTAGAAVQIASDANTNNNNFYVSAVTLTSSKVFVAYSGANYPMGIVCDISGTTITAGTSSTLAEASNGYAFVRAVALDSTRALVTHRAGSYLNGIVCTISGTSITLGTDTMISNQDQSYYDAYPTLASQDKIFVAHRGAGSSQYLYATVCNISNNVITPGTSTRLSDVKYSATNACAATLSSDKVFVSHALGALSGVICTISGTTVTYGAEKNLGVLSNEASIAVLRSDKVFIAHRGSASSYNLYGVTCRVVNTSIINSPEVAIDTGTYTSYGASAVALDDNRVFIAHYYSGYGACRVCTISDLAVASSTSSIDGLTAEECTTSTAGDVWVLNA